MRFCRLALLALPFLASVAIVPLRRVLDLVGDSARRHHHQAPICGAGFRSQLMLPLLDCLHPPERLVPPGGPGQEGLL